MKDLTEATVTIPLASLDNLRKNNKKYHDLCDGIKGYTDWMEVQSTETNKEVVSYYQPEGDE